MGRTWAPDPDHVLLAGFIAAVSAIVSFSLLENRQLIERLSPWLNEHADRHEGAPQEPMPPDGVGPESQQDL